MKITSCPVGHTCPIIDSVINTISNVVSEMKYELKQNESLENLEHWIYYLELLTLKSSEIEEIREANSELRSWGEELYNIASESLEKVETLEDKVSDLETKNFFLKKELHNKIIKNIEL